MEHGLILLIEAILAIDRNLQKPMCAVVPDLPRLRSDPRAALADGEVVFGPRKAYAVASVLGTLIGVIVLVGFVLAALDRPAKQQVETWYYVAAGISVFASGAATAALVLGWLRGGAAVLRPEGVEFVYRGRTVFCPWELFQAAGSPYHPDHKRVILPANEETPIAVTDAEGNVTGSPAAEVRSKPLTGSADGQVALADLYEVKLGELGELLLHLGRQLGDGRLARSNGDGTPSSSAPLAVPQTGGWLKVRLTRLPFPPVCTGCGHVTRESIAHTLDARHGVHIDVPLCPSCQADRKSRRSRAVMIGAAVGAVPGILLTVIGSAILPVEDLILLVILTLPVGIFIGFLTGMVVRDRGEPARFKDHSAAAGTIAMRLRPSAGTAAFLRALGVGDEEETVAADSAVVDR